MLANETLSNLRIVCFEGGDVCGKLRRWSFYKKSSESDCSSFSTNVQKPLQKNYTLFMRVLNEPFMIKNILKPH